MQKQIASWGVALLITALLLGTIRLLVAGVQGVLTLLLTNSTPDQNKAYATAIVTIPFLIFILIELYRL